MLSASRAAHLENPPFSPPPGERSPHPGSAAPRPGRRKIKNKLIAKNKGERPKTGESMAAAQGSAVAVPVSAMPDIFTSHLLLPRVKVHAQCSEQRPRHGRGEPALIIQLARDGQHGPGACDSQGRPGESRPARMRRARRKVWLRQTPIWRLEERQRRGRPPEARCGSTTSWTRP